MAEPWHVRASQFFSTHKWIVDSLLFAAPLMLIAFSFRFYEDDVRGIIHMVLLGAMGAALTFRRTFPLVTGWAVAATGLGYALTGGYPHPTLLAVPITVHAVTAYAPRRWGKIFLALGAAASLIFLVSVSAMMYLEGARIKDVTPGDLLMYVSAFFVFPLAAVAFAWATGDYRRRRTDELQRIAERSALLERERENEIRLASDAERMRIAREMHDIIAHSMSVIITQADGGRYAAARSPEAAVAALETIADTGREALGNLRGILGVLRDSEPGQKTAPMPAISDLGTLIDNVRSAGLDVTLEVSPDLPTLSPAAELAVYRVVQEALTNTMKHGGPHARASVTVRPGDKELIAGITSTGHADRSAVPGSGAGIQGMKERARVHNGTLTAEPTDTGFSVLLTLPEDNS